MNETHTDVFYPDYFVKNDRYVSYKWVVIVRNSDKRGREHDRSKETRNYSSVMLPALVFKCLLLIIHIIKHDAHHPKSYVGYTTAANSYGDSEQASADSDEYTDGEY